MLQDEKDVMIAKAPINFQTLLNFITAIEARFDVFSGDAPQETE
jgi:hypothetical protein